MVATAVFVAVESGRDDPARPERPLAAAATGPAAEGRRLFARMACGSCHAFSPARADAGIGPDLDEALRRHDRASLTATILRPGGEPVRYGFGGMPRDYGERMTERELDALVEYLLAPAGP